MLRRGFGLLDAIFGIFTIGLAVVFILPLFNISFLNLKQASEKTQMVYLAESVFESLKADRFSNPDFFEELEKEGEIYYTNILFKDFEQYICKVMDTRINDYLWNLQIIVSKKNYEGMMLNVELKGSFPK